MVAARPRVLALLLCTAVLPVSCAGGRETSPGPVVRQEAPFPAVYDPPAPDNTTEPIRYEVLRGDFHMHTVHSDGTLTPTDRVLEAWQYGYDVIAITDHSDFRAYDEALPTARALDLLLLRGLETGLSDQEHLVTLDFSPGYPNRNPHRWSETPGPSPVFYQDEWRSLAAAGGYVLYAHPHVGLRAPMLWGMSQGYLQGIEVENDVVGSGWNTVLYLGAYWYPSALDWAVEHHLTIFADSDVHGARGPNPQAVTLVLAKDRSREGVMEALRAGRTVAWFNQMLCGHQSVLQLLMASLVEVRLQEMPDGKVFLCLQNRGPVPLAAQITGMPIEPLTLGAYQKVLVGLRRRPDTDAVTVLWKNLYIRSTENLATTHALVNSSDAPRSASASQEPLTQ